MPSNGETKNALAYPIDQERSRLEKSCAAAIAGNTISSMLKSDNNAPVLLHAEIKFCATTYCAAPNTEKDVISESVRFVSTQFGNFNISEIREAFRLAAAGSIEADLTAYYGMFSVNILGRVLSTYQDHRTQAYREVRARIAAQEQEMEAEMRADILKERFGTISEQFAALQVENRKYRRWQDLPAWFCRKVIQDDIAGIGNDEKGKAWVLAKTWAVNQIGAWILSPDTKPDDKKRYIAARAANEKDSGHFPDGLRAEAEEAYCKMLVFSKIAQYEEK